MRWLRQSTAREIAVGPFLDETDGKTPETALTVTQAEVLLKKNEGDWTQKTEATSLVHESNGWYRCLLDATDTGTLGVLMLAVTEAGALPIWHEFMVVPANVWDSLFGSDNLDVSVVQWLGTAVGAGTAGVPNVDVTRISNAAVATTTAHLGVNIVNAAGTAWNSGSITAATLEADTLTAAKVAADVGTEIANAVWSLDATGQQTQGTFGQVLGDSGVTAKSIWGVANALPDSGALTTLQADTDNIQTRLPAALVSGRMDASVGAMAADVLTAAATAADFGTEIAGAVWNEDATGHQTAGTFGKAIGDPLTATNSLIQRTPDAVAGATNGLFIAGTNAATTITTALTTTFTGNLTGSVGSVNALAANVITAAATAADFGTEVAGAVWNEDATGHQTQGTFGQVLGDSGATAKSVWGITNALPDSGALTTLQADTDNIQTRIPAALVGGRIDASVGAMAADVLTAAATAADFGTEVRTGLATATNVSDTQTAILAKLPTALVGGRIDASVGAMAANVITAAAVNTDAIDADALAANAVDEILDEVIEGSVTLRQAIRIIFAACANKVAGAGTTTVTIRDLADTKDRISASVDTDGNRTSVTLDAT